MKVSAVRPGAPAEITAATTEELLAALPGGLMLPEGVSPEERRLTDVLALYRSVFLNSTEAIAIVDRAGRYLEQNPAHHALLGYTDEELRGQTPAIHLGDEAFAAIVTDLRQVGVSRHEVTSRTKAGQERIIDVPAFVVRDRLGQPVCYVGITRDVTEEHRARAELERRFEELQVVCGMTESLGRAGAPEQIYDEAIDALLRVVRADRASILLVDEDGVMRFKAFRGLSEPYRASVEGHSPWSRDTRDPPPVTVADVRADASLVALLPVLEAEGIRALAFVPLTAEGALLGKFMLYFDAPHTWTDAELRLATTVARHVSFAIVRHRRESELREANRAKSVFLATMSHELRTPLNAIAGYTDLLDAGVHGALATQQTDAVRRIQVNQRHLLRLIDDVLDFAKLEAGHQRFDIVDVPVQETLDATRMLIEPQLRSKGLTFEFVAGDPRVTCRADRAKMQQVLANLLSNAWKFTPPQGAVSLTWDASDEQVHVHVRDTGPGIPEQNLETVFEPFVQLHMGFRRRVEGTGLGLAISRELARGMSGEVTAASVVGEGSTFTLTLQRS